MLDKDENFGESPLKVALDSAWYINLVARAFGVPAEILMEKEMEMETKDEADILAEYVEQAGLAVEWPMKTADYARSVVNYANILETELVETERKVDNLTQMLLGMVDQNCQYSLGVYDSGAISTHHIVLEYLTDVGMMERYKSHHNPDGFVYRIKS